MGPEEFRADGVDRRTLLKRSAVAGASAWAAPSVLGVARAAAQTSPAPGFRFRLAGDQEVPPVVTPAAGEATLHVEGDQICIEMSAEDLSGPVIGCHIHEAPAGVNGPVRLSIGPPDDPDAEPKTWNRCFTDAALASEILAAPADYYVNIHTTVHPPGEIRGQIA